MALVSACALLWQGEQCLLSQHRLTAQHSAWNSLAWLTCLLNLSASSVTFSCPSSLFLWELVLWKRFKHTSSSPMAVAAYSSHNQNLCVKMSALGALQVFVSHHSCQNPTCKLPWPGAEDPVDKIDSLQNWLDGSTGCLYSAAPPWCLHSAELLHHSGHHFWQPLHLKCSIILSEEILLPRTKDSILEMGLCTQHLHTSHLPFLFLLCLFFLLFPTTHKFLPLLPTYDNGGMFSQVADENLWKERASDLQECLCGLSSPGCSQGNYVAPGFPLGTDGRWSSAHAVFISPRPNTGSEVGE